MFVHDRVLRDGVEWHRSESYDAGLLQNSSMGLLQVHYKIAVPITLNSEESLAALASSLVWCIAYNRVKSSFTSASTTTCFTLLTSFPVTFARPSCGKYIDGADGAALNMIRDRVGESASSAKARWGGVW